MPNVPSSLPTNDWHSGNKHRICQRKYWQRHEKQEAKEQGFIDVEQNPVITFKSTKFVQTGPHTFEVDGDFSIRGVSNPEKLVLTVTGKGTGSGEIKGSMVFNRKDYGM